MSRTQLFTVFFFAAMLFLFWQLYSVFAGFLAPIAWSVLLVVVFQPVFELLLRRVRGRRSSAAGILIALIILVVAVPATLLSGLLAREAAGLFARLSVALQSGELNRIADWAHHSRLGLLLERFGPQFEDLNLDLSGVALSLANGAGNFVVSNLGGAAKNVAVFALDLFIVLFTAFFLFRDGDRMYDSLKALIPMEPEHKSAVLKRLTDALEAVVRGIVITAVVQGLVMWIGLLLVEVPFSAFLGVLAGVLSVLPFGTPLIWVGAAIYLGVTGETGRALFITAYGALIVGSIDNFVRPLVIGGRARLSTLVLFFGLIGGIEAYGFLGIILGPVILATLSSFVDIYREQYVVAATDTTPPPTVQAGVPSVLP